LAGELAGFVIIESLLDDAEVGVEIVKDFGEGGVIITDEGFAGESHKKGDLHMDLGGINAVEGAVELGVSEELVGFLVEFTFFFEKFFGWDKSGLRIRADGFEIGGKLGKSAAEDAGEGRVDGAELGRFKAGIVFFNDVADVVHTDVKLFDGVSGLGVAILDKETDAGKQNKTHKTADENLEDGTEIAR